MFNRKYEKFCNLFYIFLRDKLHIKTYLKHHSDYITKEYIHINKTLWNSNTFNFDKTIISKLIKDENIYYVLLDLSNQTIDMKITIIQYLIDNGYKFTVTGKIINIELYTEEEII